MTSRSAGGLLLVWLLVVGSVVAGRMELATGVPHLLASEADRERAALSQGLAEGPAARTLTLLVAAADPERAAAASARWAETLAAHPEVASIELGPDPGLIDLMERIYLPRRLRLASPDPEREIAGWLSPEGLRGAAQTLRLALADPALPIPRNQLPGDPLLVSERILARFEAARPAGVESVGGRWRTASGAALLRVRTRHSPFDASRQGPFLAHLAESFAALDAATEGDLTLRWSGIHRFAVTSERRARAEATWLSTASSLAILALLLALFRSARTLGLAALPLACGIGTATALTLLVFGRLHVLTLAFGSTVIGVAIDYPLHLLHHYALAGDARPERAFANVRAAVGLGAATSIAGLAALGASDFPGLRELAVFAATGLAAAVAATSLAARLLPVGLAPSALQAGIAHRLGLGVEALGRRPRALLGILAAVLALAAWGASQRSVAGDVFALNVPLDAAALAEDRAVRREAGIPSSGTLVFVRGRDDQAALRTLEATTPVLDALVARGELGGHASVDAFLWSRERQDRNLAAFRAEPELAEKFAAAFGAAGFRPEAFGPFHDAIARDPAGPLEPALLHGTPLDEIWQSARVESPAGVTLLVSLAEPIAIDALEKSLVAVPEAGVLDQRRFAAGLYAAYLDQVLPLLALGFGAVVVLLALRLRDPARVAAAAAPPLLAALATLAILGGPGTPLSLLHLLGVLLVVCFGVDYTVFLLEAGDDVRALGAALVGTAASAASTLVAFGGLALSGFPALADLGATAALGVCVAWACALPAVAIVRAARR